MNKKRIIPCLDIRDGHVVKGINFEGIKNVGDPVELAVYYNKSGADELAFYDITASAEERGLFADILKSVIKAIMIPLTAGGGVNNIGSFERVLEYGAAKVSVNTGAIKNRSLIGDAAKRFGSERIMLSMDVKRVGETYHVFTDGGMVDTGMDAVDWAVRCEADGAGELLINSIDNDGVKKGFDLPILKAVIEKVNLPVIASGGAGNMQHFAELFENCGADAGLAASVFHFKEIDIVELKKFLYANGIPVRL